MIFDPTDDLAVFDGLEAIELWQPGAEAAVEVAGALRRAVRHREGAPAGGDYRQADTVWHLPVAHAPDRPALGSLIVVADGTAWTVLEVELATLASRWRCAARELAIEPAADTQVDLARPLWEPDAAGGPVARFEAYASDVPARVVRVRDEARLAQDERRGEEQIVVYLGARLAVRSDDRLVHGAQTYRVTQVEGLERLDRLPVLCVEEVR